MNNEVNEDAENPEPIEIEEINLMEEENQADVDEVKISAIPQSLRGTYTRLRSPMWEQIFSVLSTHSIAIFT